MRAFGMNLSFFQPDLHVDPKDAGSVIAILDRQNKEQLRYTPDMETLQEKASHWIFVPDEAMAGHHMSWLMDPASPRYQAFTAKEDWILFRKYLGQKTVAVPMLAKNAGYVNNIRLNGQPAYPPARISGQMYLIEPRHFIELDNYKQNGVVFQREHIDILIPYTELIEIQQTIKDKEGKIVGSVPAVGQDSTVSFLSAWMYSGISDFWRMYGDDSGLFIPTRPVRSRRLGKMKMDCYYQFGPKDYLKDRPAAPTILNGYEEPKDK